MQGFSDRMPMSPMPESAGGTARLQPGIPCDAAADAEAMWQLSNHLNSLQLQQAQLSGEHSWTKIAHSPGRWHGAVPHALASWPCLLCKLDAPVASRVVSYQMQLIGKGARAPFLLTCSASTQRLALSAGVSARGLQYGHPCPLSKLIYLIY